MDIREPKAQSYGIHPFVCKSAEGTIVWDTLELGGTQILKTVQYFIKYHGITNYHGIWLTQMNTFNIQLSIVVIRLK